MKPFCAGWTIMGMGGTLGNYAILWEMLPLENSTNKINSGKIWVHSTIDRHQYDE